MLTLTIAWVGCSSSVDEQNVLSVDELVASFIDMDLNSPREVRAVIGNASACERSISFLDMQWSMNSHIARRPFAQFVVEYHRVTKLNAADMHFIDCTSITHDYSPLTELPGWDKQLHPVAGMGEVMWMQNGRVLHVAPINDFQSTDELVAKTAALFENGG